LLLKKRTVSVPHLLQRNVIFMSRMGSASVAAVAIAIKQPGQVTTGFVGCMRLSGVEPCSSKRDPR
jgi:hypothetical protein